jgi:hypothetical protein
LFRDAATASITLRCAVTIRLLVVRCGFPHVISKLLQGGAQPSLVVSFFLLFAFVRLRDLRHLRNERFDDLVDRFVDGHRMGS